MPNQHVQDVIDEQTKHVQYAKQNCSEIYGPDVGEKYQSPFYNETTKNYMCHAYWDTILCWHPTPAGEVSTMPCPSYIAGFRSTHNATRTCTENGSWYINETTNEPWADYTACMESQITTIFRNIHKTNISPNSEILLPAIKIISQTGYAVSLISLIIAFLIMLLIKKLHCARNILHMNLFASFILRAFFYILKDVLFVDGIGFWYDLSMKNGDMYFKTDTEKNNFECKLLTTVVQYFTTANYSWILMEGVYLNNLIFRALFTDSGKNLPHYVCFGWGLPLLVIIPWVIARLLIDDTLCWTMNDNFIPLLIIGIPTIISVLINLVLFVIISVVLYTKLRSPINEDTKKYQKWAKSTLVLVPLFGVHYAVLLIFYFVGQTTIWLIFDTLFGSFQGFFVAVLYCFLNGEVKTELKPHIYSALTYLATHRFLKLCFPCRNMFLRSAVGRQSVCTTMSCSSLYANGIAHRNSKSKWEMFQKGKHTLAVDKSKDHFCSRENKHTKNGSQTFGSNNKNSSTMHGNTNNHAETILCIDHRPDKSEELVIDEEICMLEENC